MTHPVAARPPATRELDTVVREHAYLGLRMQLVLRALLVGFVGLGVGLVAPVRTAAVCYAVLVSYAVAACAVAWWARRAGPDASRWGWAWLFLDLAVLAGLTLATGIAAQQSWTSYVLINGLFLIPVLAANELRVGVCAAVVVPTVVAYLGASLATQGANQEPMVSILLRTLVLLGVGAGCVALSAIQRSRVRTIGGLVSDRTALLGELLTQQARERQALSEQLHDGALQYVLAARQDLDELRERAEAGRAEAASTAGPATHGATLEISIDPAFARLAEALTESARLLRSMMTELHPSVLAHAGLAGALRDFARGAQARAGFALEVDTDRWPERLVTPADGLLFGAARELVTNVVKHADARAVRITLTRGTDRARLVVTDDGKGIPDDAVATAVARGHIGLRSQQLRLQAAGGQLTLDRAQPAGTVATVELPLSGVG